MLLEGPCTFMIQVRSLAPLCSVVWFGFWGRSNFLASTHVKHPGASMIRKGFAGYTIVVSDINSS